MLLGNYVADAAVAETGCIPGTVYVALGESLQNWTHAHTDFSLIKLNIRPNKLLTTMEFRCNLKRNSW